MRRVTYERATARVIFKRLGVVALLLVTLAIGWWQLIVAIRGR